MKPSNEGSRGIEQSPQLDFFDQEVVRDIGRRLAAAGGWPDESRFPVNLADRTVKGRVLADLAASANPLIVSGYASLDRIIDFTADLSPKGGRLRLLLGNEPFESRKKSFAHGGISFEKEMRDYWLERGISLSLSAKLVAAIDRIKAGSVEARHIEDERRRLHAKIYVADAAVTVGSSNFTSAGLSSQLEANVRFSAETEKKRYTEASNIAERYWQVGKDFSQQLVALLEQLLQVVTWQEALARACAELLEGRWASRYLGRQLDLGDTQLWPSQQAGIAQALWVLENIGSVLVADATGSGKTRMGAHLLRALRDRIWSTGRTRSDLSVLVCPPSVEQTWQKEAVNCGLPLQTCSHGMLSRRDSGGYEQTSIAVRRAQTLAVDEAHNFLNLESRRTQELLSNIADNVVLFTATPINRGGTDLLSLIEMLGADNMEEEALEVLEGLARRRGSAEQSMGPKDVEALRSEIQRFTVRRTKSALNALVDQAPDAYLDPEGQRCRYPRHLSMTYRPGESPRDKELAVSIRRAAAELRGIALIEQRIEMPEAYRAEGWTEDRYLRGRLLAVRHLALHNIMATLRSSRAALVEHLVGTKEAMRRFDIKERPKSADTGDIIGKLDRQLRKGKPECALECQLPDWLAEDERFREACAAEIALYQEMLVAVTNMSSSREKSKAQHLCRLIEQHRLVLAFDSRLISLEVIRRELQDARVGAQIIVASSTDASARKRVRKVFDRTSKDRGIALCSDSMSEGVNLQGASAIVHLDMPSVVRIAEQRVGRVDRMDSPHDAIEAWWPEDSAEFALRADERFVQRYQTVDTLLGSNLPLPDAFGVQSSGADETVSVQELMREAEDASTKTPWDRIQDAFGPVRDLISGEHPLVPKNVYEEYAGVDIRVLSRIGVVSSKTPWAFFAVSGFEHGAPKWVLIEDAKRPEPVVSLDRVCALLQEKLSAEPANLKMDGLAVRLLDRFLSVLQGAERRLLPRRKQRALEQMEVVVGRYADEATKRKELKLAARWNAVLDACRTGNKAERPDLDAVAEQWLTLVRPVWFAKLKERRKRRRPLLLKDIQRDLLKAPLHIEQVEAAFNDVPITPPLDERIAACIIGMPADRSSS